MRTILESKKDQENFMSKFGKEALNFFQKYSQRLINNKISTDLTYHIKNTSREEMNKIIHDLENKIVKDSHTGEAKLNRDYLGSGNGYKVYKINDWETSMNMGERTNWCISGRYDTNDVKPSQAKQYFNEYSEKGSKFYFLFNEKFKEVDYCIVLYEFFVNVGEGTKLNFQIWDKFDNNKTSKYGYLDLPYDLIPGLKIISK